MHAVAAGQLACRGASPVSLASGRVRLSVVSTHHTPQAHRDPLMHASACIISCKHANICVYKYKNIASPPALHRCA